MSDTSETDIPIWVDGMVKYVTGLTRRTTCDDVTYALMEQELKGNVDVGAYAVFERWRGVERPLKGRTKILKVWRAWGDEQDSVVLTLRRLGEMFRYASCESLRSKRLRKHQPRDREPGQYRQKDNMATHRRDKTHPHKQSRRKDVLTSSRLYEARDTRAHGALSRELNNNTKHASSTQSSSKESLSYTADKLHSGKIRCMTHKTDAYCDDENNNQEVVYPSRHVSSDHAQSRIMQEMAQLILAQQQQIKDQVRRTEEVDVQIEHYENKLHQVRMRDHGRDYVQKAYIQDHSSSEESSADEKRDLMKAADLQTMLLSESTIEMASGLSGKDLEEFLNIADDLLVLEDRLNTKQHAIQELSMRIEESAHDLPLGNESSLLVSPPSLYAGMNPADICWEKENAKLANVGYEELLDTKSKLVSTCSLSRAQQQQIEELEQQINGFDVKINAMKEYADILGSELNQLGPNDANVDNDLFETSVIISNESIQLNADPRTSTPYVPGIARQERFVGEFLASPTLKPSSPKLPQGVCTLYNYPDQEYNLKLPSPKHTLEIPQSVYTPYNSLDKESKSSLSTSAFGFNHGSSSDDSTRFSQDSREYTSTSEESGPSLVYYDKRRVTKKLSYAQMNLYSTKEESTRDCDSNSDTGLSSLHSDDAAPILVHQPN